MSIDQPPFWEQRRGGGPVTDEMDRQARNRERADLAAEKEARRLEIWRASEEMTTHNYKPQRRLASRRLRRMKAEYVARWGEDPMATADRRRVERRCDPKWVHSAC